MQSYAVCLMKAFWTILGRWSTNKRWNVAR